ncbi:MAG: hypothetical protein H8F28_02060 [Fibrella sp.]|nr:hypothetical protein [Armatimonadota bacterium]
MPIDGLAAFVIAGLLACGCFLGIVIVLIFVAAKRAQQTGPLRRQPAFSLNALLWVGSTLAPLLLSIYAARRQQ